MTQIDITNSRVMEAIDAQTFRKKFRLLIFVAWSVPAIFGLSFILYVKILSMPEMVGVMTHPLEPLFMAFWFTFSLWYFTRFAQPIVTYLENPGDESIPAARDCVRRFPLHFWSLFLLYLLMAPVSVIWAAELYAGFVPQPVDWFRINMVALIVSIIVGLPIFFLILDLFGRALSGVHMGKPHITIKTKVFLIGALVPLLIDTMLVQYYWSRTGFFSTETFIVWLFLELLAIGGSLIFVRSFGQSLAPLEAVFDGQQPLLGLELNALKSQSTDEIGVLTTAYRNLLGAWQTQSEMLELNNSLLRKAGNSMSLESVADSVISIAGRAIEGDMCFLLLHDAEQDELVGVAQTGAEFNASGHFRVAMDEPSLAILAFKKDQTFAIADVQTDPNCSSELRQRFKIQSALSAPLRLEGKPIGVLMSSSTSIRRDYSERDEAVIQGLAREAALAINTQRLNDQKLQVEAVRHEKDELIELLMDSTEEAIYGVDLDGNCTFVNRACVEMLGYDDESELLGQGVHALIHHTWPDGSPHPRAECAVHLATLEQSSAHGDDEVYWRKDGSSLPIEYWSHPIRKEGEIVGTVVTFLDISERINTRKELEQSSERLGLAIDAGDIGVWEWDIATDRLDWSQKMEETFGMQAGEFKGQAQDFYDRVYPADMEMLARATSDALEKDAPFSVEHRIVKADSSIGWVHCQANVKRDVSGKPVGMIGVLTDITAQKEDDKAVYRLKSTLDMTTDCVFMFDPETLKFNYVNLGAINQVGSSEQEMLDMSPLDIKPEFDEPAFRRLIQPMLDGKLENYQFETIHQHKNGDLIPVEISLSYVQPVNEPARFVAIVHDITERRQIENNLRASQEMLQRVLDNIPVRVFWKDRDLNYLGCNQLFARDAGFDSPGQLIGKSDYDMGWARQADLYRADDKEVIDTGKSKFNYEEPQTTPDGKSIWRETSKTPLTDTEGRTFGLLGTYQEITTRKRVTDIMQFLASTSASLKFDVFLNESLRNLTNLFGCKYAFVGRLLEDKENVRTLAVWADDKPAENFEYNLQGTPCQDILDLSVELVPKDAVKIYHENQMLIDMGVESYFGVPMLSANGELLGLVSVMDTRPMTPDEWAEPILSVFASRIAVELERKLAMDELHQHRDHLEEMVDARTNELQAVNKELEAFSYSVSHDLRTPLRSIDGFSLALLEDYRDELDKDGRDYLSRIRGGAQKMAELIDDLLDLSRVTRSKFKREVVDLSAVTFEVLKELAAREPERQVETRIAEGVIVRGDRRLLKVVMNNLLGNAWKYTGKQEKAEIEFGVFGKNGETVYHVRDNGAGFDMKYADKLFGAFQRLHSSNEFPGTGVGLATVQRIVHRHGGQIWAEAKPNLGATIYFSLGIDSGGDNEQQEYTAGRGQPRR